MAIIDLQQKYQPLPKNALETDLYCGSLGRRLDQDVFCKLKISDAGTGILWKWYIKLLFNECL